MTRNAQHWANNCAGIFWISVLFMVMVYFGSRLAKTPMGGGFFTLMCVIAAASLAGWVWLAFKAGQNVASKTFPHG